MYISNWVFRPAPGTLPDVIQNSSEIGKLWVKHGANECHLLNLQGADVGCVSFIAQFDNAEGYGKANDAIVADEEFQALMAKASAMGGEWVRHNLARRIY